MDVSGEILFVYFLFIFIEHIIVSTLINLLAKKPVFNKCNVCRDRQFFLSTRPAGRVDLNFYSSCSKVTRPAFLCPKNDENGN